MEARMTHSGAAAGLKPRVIYEASRRWHKLGKLTTWRFFGNTLDPMINLRYLGYGRECRASARGALAGEPPEAWPLRAEPAFAVPGCFTPERAARMSARIGVEIEAGRVVGSKGHPSTFVVDRPIELFGMELFDAFSGPLERELLRVYGSYFRPEWVTCYRAYPGERASSWLWHIDNIPPYVIKAIVYLTDSDAETGAMQIMSSESTTEYMKNGYFGVYGTERLAHLEEFARAHGLSHDVRYLEAKAGDAIVFNPNHLHRGGHVATGFRDVLSFQLVPSEIPWKQWLSVAGAAYLQACSGFPLNPRLA